MSVQGSYSVPVCQLPLASSSEVIFWSSCHFLRKERREKEEKKKENFPNRCCIFYCIMRLCVMRTQDCIIAFSEFIHNIGSHYSRNTRTVYYYSKKEKYYSNYWSHLSNHTILSKEKLC